MPRDGLTAYMGVELPAGIASVAMDRATGAAESVIRHATVLESTLAAVRSGTTGVAHDTLELAAAQRAAEMRGGLDLLASTASRIALDGTRDPADRAMAMAASDAYAGAMRTTDGVLRGDRPLAHLQGVVDDVRRGHQLLQPGATAPKLVTRAEQVLYADERASVVDAGFARTLRRGSPIALDAVESTLRDGTPVAGQQHLIHAAGNANGDLPIELLRDARTGDTRSAVVKSPQAQAAQEEFGRQVLRTLGVDYLAPPTARRADGSAAIEFFERAQPFWQLDVRTQGDWDRVLADAWQAKFPNMDRAEAGRAAIVDRQLVQFADWLTANPDRHVANGLVLPDRTAAVIDHGFIGRGESDLPLRPRMKPELLPGTGSIVLGPEARDQIRRTLTPDVLERLHATLRADAGALEPDASARLAQDASTTSLERMQARLRHAVDDGRLEYEPLDSFAHPLYPDRHPTWS